MHLSLSIIRHTLTMARPFVLSYGQYTQRQGMVITLSDGRHTGYGEGTAIPYYGWSIDEMVGLADAWPMEIAQAEVVPLISSTKCAPLASALSCAYYDLCARQQGQQLCQYMNLSEGSWPVSLPITITGVTKAELQEQIHHYDWPAYKIKMGGAHDAMLADIIMKYPQKRFFIDANAGWDDVDLAPLMPALRSPQVVLIEQPYPIGELTKNAELAKLTDKPIIADESCQRASDIPTLAPYFTGINIKLMKCGGWDEAISMREAAAAHGLRVMVGCMTETSIGISHGAHLARGADWADLDGSLLLTSDPASGAYIDRGTLTMSHAPGSGARWKK